MAQDADMNPAAGDAFSPIANHYDAIMEHVDYARWRHVTEALGEMLPRPLMHLDAGCGTGTLIEHLAQPGWHSAGIDLSPTMLRVAKYRRKLTAIAQADLCALPFREQFHLISCLFDSMNFLLHDDMIRQAMNSFEKALLPGGLLYFDMVTRRMITDHFNNESWVENHGRFRSTWRSTYNPDKRLCETRVRVNSGEESVTYERVYPLEFIEESIERAGLTLLAVRDAYTWKKPGRRTTRVDFIAAKGNKRAFATPFKEAERSIKVYVTRRKS
jgi:SAM-dependent methyltransferase